MQYLGLCVFSLPTSLMIIVRIRVLIVIPKSVVWPICHCLGLGHETMVCAVCRFIFVSKSYELDIIFHVLASQLSCYCVIISNWLWRHLPNVNRASEMQGRYVNMVFVWSFMKSLYRERNKAVYALTRILFTLFHTLLYIYLWCRATQ